MLLLSDALLNKPIMSLRTGTPVATVLKPIFNPNNLKIEGFHCQDTYENKQLILRTGEIREVLSQGFVVNDHESLSEPEDLIRLQEVIKIDFQLDNKLVYTVSKEKIGRVSDYAVDSTSLYVQKLYVGRSILKSLSSGQISIDRTHIVEITNKKIIIQEILKPTKSSTVPATPLAG